MMTRVSFATPFRPRIGNAVDMSPDALRHMAMGIEEALERDTRGVSLEKSIVKYVTRALWDYADRIELDTE